MNEWSTLPRLIRNAMAYCSIILLYGSSLKMQSEHAAGIAYDCQTEHKRERWHRLCIINLHTFSVLKQESITKEIPTFLPRSNSFIAASICWINNNNEIESRVKKNHFAEDTIIDKERPTATKKIWAASMFAAVISNAWRFSPVRDDLALTRISIWRHSRHQARTTLQKTTANEKWHRSVWHRIAECWMQVLRVVRIVRHKSEKVFDEQKLKWIITATLVRFWYFLKRAFFSLFCNSSCSLSAECDDWHDGRQNNRDERRVH